MHVYVCKYVCMYMHVYMYTVWLLILMDYKLLWDSRVIHVHKKALSFI